MLTKNAVRKMANFPVMGAIFTVQVLDVVPHDSVSMGSKYGQFNVSDGRHFISCLVSKGYLMTPGAAAEE